MLAKLIYPVPVLIAALPDPLAAHDIYSHLTDANGASCCSDRDCRPAMFRVTRNAIRMFVAGRWIEVPADKIEYRSLPGDDGRTGGGRGCGWALDPTGPAGDGRAHTICAVLPSDLLSDRRSAALEALAIPPLGHRRLCLQEFSAPVNAVGSPRPRWRELDDDAINVAAKATATLALSSRIKGWHLPNAATVWPVG